MPPLTAVFSISPERSTLLLELRVIAAPGVSIRTTEPSWVVILPGVSLDAVAVARGVVMAVLLPTVKSSAKADSAMPASNATELTPQISELLFKTNPAEDEFCLVFRRR